MTVAEKKKKLFNNFTLKKVQEKLVDLSELDYFDFTDNELDYMYMFEYEVYPKHSLSKKEKYDAIINIYKAVTTAEKLKPVKNSKIITL